VRYRKRHNDMDSDRDREQDTYRDAGGDERFDAADACTGKPGSQREPLRVTVLDARGAVLLDGPAAARYGDDLLTVRYTDPTLTGRGLLPVRPDADADPRPEPHSDGLTGPYQYAVAHYHHHAHGTAAGDVLTHSHKHEHTGAESRRANELGHTADVHAHPH